MISEINACDTMKINWHNSDWKGQQRRDRCKISGICDIRCIYRCDVGFKIEC